MELQRIYLRELKAFLESERYRKAGHLPISLHRGRSHSNNPLAEPVDLVLVVMWEEDKVVGYRGVLPDRFNLGGRLIRMAWTSGIWVDPSYRRQGIGTRMVRQFVDSWEGRLCAIDPTPANRALFQRLGGFFEYPVHGLRAYLRLNLAELLPRKNPKYGKFKGLLRIGDDLFNYFNAIRLRFFSKHFSGDLEVQTAQHLDDEGWNFISEHQKETPARRNRQTLEWALQNPWILPKGQEKLSPERYHFSSVADHFETTILKVRAGQKLSAVLIITLRDGAMRVPGAWFNKGDADLVVKVIIQFALQRRIKILSLFYPPLVGALQKMRTPFFLKRPLRRLYVISNRFKPYFESGEINFQDGDGDVFFV